MTPPTSHPLWHTVSPQTRPLTLTVLGLTPLALTVSLSLTPAPAPASLPHQQPAHHPHHHTPAHHKNRKRHRKRVASSSSALAGEASEEDDQEDSDPGLHDGGVSFKDLLRHGVLVYVNGAQSNNLFANVMDDDDEEDWEDETDSTALGQGEDEEEIMEQGITRRRPRKARFGASASAASGALDGQEGKGSKKKDEKHSHKGDRDRAVLVIYGLQPAKEYEVELRVVGMGGQESEGLASQSVLIPASPNPSNILHPRSRANSLRSRSRPRSRSNSLTAPTPSTPIRSDHGQGESPPSPVSAEGVVVPTPILNAVDTQAAQLRHLISSSHSEKDHLQSQIKEARRTAQRQEASLKSEIEAVKKATEKAGGLDLRAKQKALALQEQVKQAWAGAESAEAEMKEVEKGLDALENSLRDVQKAVDIAKEDWKVVKDVEDKAREEDRKTRSEEDRKLAEVVSKIEKLRTKKAKKEAEGQDLEKKLEELEREREEAERRNEEGKVNRSRTMSYYAAGYGGQNQSHELHDPSFGHASSSRTLTAHPSLSNISGSYAAGPAYRPRAAPGYTPRYPSGGARPGSTQASPTHQTGFYPLQPPVPPSTSPAFRPGKLNPPSQSSISSGSSVARPGVNAAAMPFHPGGQSPANWTTPSPTAGAASTEHTTALMPPQLQHRIYLPNSNARLRPFQPPAPSSLQTETRASTSHPSTPPIPAASASSGSSGGNPFSPAFPPLPGGGAKPSAQQVNQSGPSLASIVQKVVLVPSSNLTPKAGPSSPAVTPPIVHSGGSQRQAQTQAKEGKATYTGEFPPLSPTWGGPFPGMPSSSGSSPMAMPLSSQTQGSQGQNSQQLPGLSMREGMPSSSGTTGAPGSGGVNNTGSGALGGAGASVWAKDGVSGAIMKKWED